MIEPDRRSFLKAALAGVAGASLSLRSLARSQESITVVPLADQIVQITGAGGNVVALTGSDGVLLVDSGLDERSKALLRTVAGLPGGKHVHTLINTHWHWDHTGGNERLGKDKVRIIAHENTKLWLGADFYCDWQNNRHYTPRPRQAWPTETFYSGGGKLTTNGEDVVYGYLPRAHTDGDVYVFFPKANVLVAGGLMSVGSYPILDYTTGGWIGGMSEASKALLGVANKDTLIVPGAGPVQRYADLQAQSEMLATMKERLVELMRKGMGTDDLAANPPTREFDAKWGDPQVFLANAYRGMWGHVRELGKIV